MDTECLLTGIDLPIVLVGNGPIDFGYASWIDSHGSVIRLNNYTLEYPHLTGEKTTHWIVNGGRQIVDRGLQPMCVYSENKYPKDLVNNFANRIRKAAYTKTDFYKTLSEKHPQFKYYEGMNMPLTTGFMAAWVLLELGYSFRVIGFDFLKSGHLDDPSFTYAQGHYEHIRQEEELLRVNYDQRVDIY